MGDRPLPGWPAAMGEDWAAAYIGVSASKLRELVGNDRITRVKLDGRYLYYRADLDAFLDRLAGRAPSSVPAGEWETA